MNKARWFFLLLVLSLASLVLAGDIQVFCEPGLSIFVDGELAGVSSERDDGLYLMDLPRGKHTVTVEKSGCLAQSFEVEVLDIPLEIETVAFTPTPPLEQKERKRPTEVKRQAGSVVLSSVPQRCSVEIDGQLREKDTPQLTIGGLAAGTHKIVFSKAGYEPISGVVAIPAGVVVAVRGNLKAGKVEVAQKGEGSLRVISTPSRCTVLFRGKRWEKTSMKLNLSRVPAGEYPIVVSYRGQEHVARLLIKDGQRTIVRVDFMRGDEAISVSYLPQ